MSISMVGSKAWKYIDLLSAEDTQLFKPVGNSSAFDADNDLILRSLSAEAVDKITLRFIPPVNYYQFVEIDIVALADSAGIIIAALSNCQANGATSGEVAYLIAAATNGRKRTYRLPFIGEIEALVFSNITASTPVSIKAIRFFSRTPELCCFVAQDTDETHTTNSAHIEFLAPYSYEDWPGPYSDWTEVPYSLLGLFSQAVRENNRYLFAIAPLDNILAQAIFTMDGALRSFGLVRVTLPVNISADVLIQALDQAGIINAIAVTANVVEFFVTQERQIIDLRLQSSSLDETVFAMIELFFFGLRQQIAAFGCVERNNVCC